MKHTKKFLKRTLTLLLVLLTLFSTVSVGVSAAMTEGMPETYTQEIDMGGDDSTQSDEPLEEDIFIPVGGITENTDDPVIADENDGVANSLGTLVSRAGKDIAGVGANVDVAATGWDQSSGTVYFDATGWSVSTLYVLIGHDTWSSCYSFSKVAGSIYKCSLPSWSGATSWCIINAGSGWGDEGNSPTHRKAYATNSTSVKTSAVSTGSCYNTSASTVTLTFSATTGAAYSQNGGSSYTAGTTGGTVTVSGTNSSGSSTSSSSSITFLRTTNVTFTATAASNYTFKGWYTTQTSTSTSATSTSSSYTVSAATAAKTFYARFSLNGPYTVTVSAGTGGSASAGSTSVYYGKTTTITATASTGYTFSKWTVSGSGSVSSTTSASTTLTVTGAVTVTASFTINTYKLTLNRNYAYGTVSGAGTYNYNTKVSISASPNTGYYFGSWTVTSGNSPASTSSASTTVTLTQATTLQANFYINTYKLTLNRNNTSGGSVSGAGTYNHGTSVSISATPATGYNFTSWTVTSGNSPASTSSASTTVTLTQATTLQANFTIKSYTVTFKDWDGTTLKTQTVNHGSAATAPSNPTRTGYTFAGWDKTYSSITANTTVTATYTINSYTVTFKDDAAVGGATLKTQTVNYGSAATAPTVSASDGWEFYSWDKDFSNITANTTVTAIRSNQNVQLLGDVIGSWTASTSNRMTYNSSGTNTKTVTLPKGTYELKIYTEEWGEWKGNSGTVTDSCSGWDMTTGANNLTLNASGGKYTFTYTRSTGKLSISYTAVTYTVTIGSATGGSASATSTTVNLGDTTTLTASASKGYTFSSWSIGSNATISSGSTTSSSVTIVVNGNVTCTPSFTGNSGTVTYAAGTGGAVSSTGGSVTYPNEKTSTATASEGYTFSSWTISGGTSGTDYTISTGSTTSATIGIKVYTSGTTIKATANFTANTSSIEFKTGTGGSVSNTGATNVTYPSTKASTATASYGYTFSKWTISGGTLNTDYKITSGSTTSTSITIQPLTSGKTIVATASFTKKSYTVTIGSATGGSASAGSTSVTYGSTTTVTATPSTGYQFKSWTITSADTSHASTLSSTTTNPTTLTVNCNVTVTPVFEKITYTVTLAKTPTAGGTVSATSTSVKYKESTTITATPATGYNFTKWEITSGTGTLSSSTSASTTLTIESNVTVRATFTIKSYTVTFKDGSDFGGETLSTQTITHGSAATAPTVSTESGWEFSSWDKDFSNITSNLTVTANRINKNVQLLGDVIGSWSVSTSNRMTYGSTTNTKTVTLPKGNYEFKLYTEDYDEWRGNGGTIVDTTDTTASAGWDTWVGGNNFILQASGGKYTFTYDRTTYKLKITYTAITYNVTASASPTAAGSTTVSNGTVNLGDVTTLKATTNKGYTFSNWTFSGTYTITDGSTTSTSITISPTTAVTATANYTANSGTVTYATSTGGSVTNRGDNAVTYPSEIKSTATASTGYTFKEWTISGGTEGTDYTISTGSTTSATIGIKVYTSGKTITATAKFTANSSTIKFVAGTGGSVTNSGSNSVTYPNTIASTATPSTGYNFSSWSISGGTLNTDYKITAGGTDQTSITIQPITSGKTITVTANFTIKQYYVTFKNWDGTQLKKVLVDHGSAATAPSNPTRESTAQYSYTFKGWDTDFSNVTSDLTVTATYTQTVRSYTVTFVDYDGTVLKTQSVQYGSAATAPSDPSRSDGWIFSGWDKDFSNITGALTVTAQYWDNNVYLMGITGSWEQNSTTKMSYGTTSSMTLTLDEGTYEFKFVYKGSWLGNNGELTNTTDYNGSSNPWETYDGNNIKFNAIGGTYKFTFNKETYRFEVKHTPITYTVKFYNDGTLIKTETVNRGDDATAPSNPTKAADAQYTYTFSKWDTDFTGVRANLTVNAVYTKTVNKYAVIFKDYDGTVLKTQNVEYGSAATAPDDPTRTGYTFSGWDKDFSNITGALTVTAQYTINGYTVRFENWDGTLLKSETVTYGSGATAPSNPTRPADAQYTYTFKGWDKSFAKITADTTVTATYTQTVNYYTVTFVNWDGYVYKTQSVAYGSAATAPSNPSRNDGWTFIGWDKDFSNITGDTTVTALWTDNNVYLQGDFTSWTQKADVTKMSYGNVSVMSLELAAGTYEFKLIYGSNENGNIWYGNNGEIQDTTLATSDIGWEMTTSANNCKLIATGGTYTFYFNKNTKYLVVEYFSNAHDVTFKNDDGTTLSTAKVEDGKYATSVAPANPSKNATAEYTYTFAGWTPDISTTQITADTTFTATYTATKNKYTVTFVNWDDSVLKTDTVEYGSSATAPTAPSRAATAQYTYTFKGWDKAFSNVTSNITVKAEFTATVNKYDVTFKYYTADGQTEKSETKSVEYGSAATAPTIPTRTDGWVFTGWDADFSNITANLVVTALYRDDNIYLNGSFFDNWGYKKAMTASGDTYTYTVTLVPGTYQFKLNQDFTWYGNGGTIVDTTAATSATGWDMYTDAGNCTLEASGGAYTFSFNNSTKKLIVSYAPTMYTVTFKNWDGTELKTEEVAIGKSATAPDAPTKPSTVQYDYTFSGWDKDFSSVTSNMTVTAQFKETLRKYTVTFCYEDADGKATSTEQSVEYGSAATAPEVPFRADGYALRQWDTDFSNITGDLTVTAVYFNDNAYIKGQFNNWDDSGLLTTYGNKTVSKRIELTAGTYEFKFYHDGSYYTDVNAGTVSDTTGDYWWSTTNSGDVGNTKLTTKGGWYTFTWNTENKSFKISYEPYMYTVTFKDYNGKTLDTQSVAISTAATEPATPTRTDGFVFDYWDTDFSSVTSDLTVTAVYYDNNIYLMGIDGDWTSTTAANRLTYQGTENVVELTIDIGKTSGDTFTQSQHEFKFKQHNTWYTYKPVSGSSKVINDSTMNSWYDTNTNDVDNNNTILNASGGSYTFKFATDTKDFNIHYEAIQYEVIFYDYALNVLKREMVDIGKGATAPDVPTRSNGFKFLKWDKDFSCITDRTEVYARYYDDKMYLSGDFNNWGTTALGTYGDKIQSATFVLEPGSYSFNFFHNEPVDGEAVRHYHTDINNGTFENVTTGGDDGWWNTKKADGGQTTLNATGGIYTFYYNTETNQFKVTYTPNVFDVTFVYYDTDGETLIEDVQDVKLGEAAIAPEVPVRKDGWVFSSWDKEFTNIQGDLTVTALYIDENVYITAQFNNWNEKATPLELTETKDIVKITLEFTPGEYDFKFHRGDGWYSYDGTITDETASAIQMNASVENNAKLKATGGYYTFTYNKSNDTLEVDYEPYMYTVTFVDYDDTVLKTEKVAISTGATAPADPTRSDGFVFTGWDMMFDNIQADLTVKAQYRDDNVYIRGTFPECDWADGFTMKYDATTATYTIRKIDAGNYEFKFFYDGQWYTNDCTITESVSDWETYDSSANIILQAVKGSYIFTFNKETKRFSVEFKPDIHLVTFYYYGTTYEDPRTTVLEVEDGGTAKLPELETRTDSWFYLFWAARDESTYPPQPVGTRYTQDITNVTSDMEIHAWYYDDNVFLVGDVIDGQWSRTDENKMTYDFVSGTSTYETHLNHGQTYNFKFIYRVNDSLLDNFYGNGTAINPSVDYTNVWTNSQLYVDSDNITLNAVGGTYKFIYNRNNNQLSIEFVPDVFTVTFVDEDGTTVLKTENVTITKDATAPEMDELRDGYRRFGGWDKSYENITSDITVKAQYYDDNYYLRGSFNEWGTTNVMGAYGESTVTTGLYLEPGQYTFKISHNTGVSSTDWFGSDATINDSTTGLTMNVDANCTLNASGGYYTFKYTPSTNTLVVEYDATEFTVIFMDWNGTVLDTQTVKRGMSAIAPADPTREGDVQYSYIFSGWSKDFSDVQSDMEITAVFTQVVNKYKVTFVDHNNEVIAVVDTEYGTAAVAPSVPARADGWVFSHWDKDFSNITGDLTVQAQYINGNVFLVGDFNDWNETTLPMAPTGNANEFSTTVCIHYGLTNQFKIKVGDGWFGNSGTFTDTTDVDGNSNPWYMEQTTNGDQSNTTINTTGGYYTFIYNIVTQRLEVKYEPFIFTVNFYDYNDVLLKTEQVAITKSATPPTEPTRDGGFSFKSWSTSDYTKVMDNLDVYAQYYDDNLYLKGTFNEWGTENVFAVYGDSVVSTTIELEPGTYTFKIYKEAENNTKLWYTAPSETIVDSTDWIQSYDGVELGDTILIANGGYYTFTFNHENKNFKIDYKPYKYDVTFVYISEDCKTEIRDTQSVDRGSSAIAPDVPFRADGMAFSGWDKEYSYITEDITVTAKYFDDNLYLVGDFNNWGKTNVLTNYGDTVLSARVEIKPGVYEFKFMRNGTYFTDINAGTVYDSTGADWWSASTSGSNTKLNATGGWYTFTFATDTQTFKVEYEPYVYTVNFKDWDGTILKTEQVEISKDATAPADPTREHYDFTGWDKTFTNIQGNLDVTATYKIHNFQVTFVYYTSDCKETSTTQTVDYGSAAVAPELPRRQDGWVFSYWDKDFSFITEDITITAKYINDNVYLVGDFNNWNETTLPMELTEDENVVQIKITLDEGSYDFKLKRGDGWFSNSGDINNTTDYNGGSNPWYMEAGDAVPNCTLITTGGNYTFIYNKETQRLEVKYSPYTYVVTFKNWDGTVLKEQTVNIGEDATPPANPTRPDEGNIVYTFDGWDGSFNNVKADTVVTAKYKETTRELTVTFKDWDGTVLSTQTVEAGEAAEAPADPTREGNAQYSYTFSGWDTDFSNVTEDITVTATYERITNKYTVTFVDWNGTVLKTEQVEYGSSATAPTDPTRTDYVFTGWDVQFTNITSDLTVTAKYADNRIYLKGDFNNWGTNKVMTSTGEANLVSVIVDIEPGTYKFKLYQNETWYGNDGSFVDTTETTSDIGWEMTTSAGDCTITATGGEYLFIFNTETKMLQVIYNVSKFTVVFLDWDGTVLSTQEVAYGQAAVAPETPTREGFKFAGWDTDFSYIDADTVVIAKYAEIGVQYTVTFVNWDGTVLSEQTVEAGETAVAPEDPTREGDQQYSYTFNGWDTDFTYVGEDLTVTATYVQVVNKYNVTFKDWDDRTLKIQEVEYGASATAPADPTRAGYIFSGWDTDFTFITEAITVKAQYADAQEFFTVTFKDWDGTVLATVEVMAGEDAAAPADPTRTGDAQYSYVFKGWDKEFTNVLTNLTVTALYDEFVNSYTVVFKNWDGTVLKTETVEYGKSAAGPSSNPTRSSDGTYYYTFNGWDTDFNNVKQNLTVTAVFTRTAITHTVTFVNGVTGKVITTKTVTNNGTVTAPTPPTIDGYVFTGWDGVLTGITSNRTITAVYKDDRIYIVGDFNNWVATEMTHEGNNIYSATFNFEQSIQEFKIKRGQDDWYGLPSGNNVIEDETIWRGVFTDSDNCALQATGGMYKISFNKNTNELKVEYVSAPEYTVKFVNWDGTVLKTETVKKGKAATEPATNPTRPDANGVTYTFIGWDTDYSYVTADITVTAQYIGSNLSYVVTFVDWDGTVIDTQTVGYGDSAIAPADPIRPNYTFIGWNRSFTNVTANITVMAQYQGNKYYITVDTTDSSNGTASTTKNTYVYGDVEPVTLTATPADGYSFKRWSLTGSFEIVSGSTTTEVLIIRPTSDVVAIASFGQGVQLTVHSYSTKGYENLYLWESNGTLTNYPVGDWPGTEQPLSSTFNGVTWKTSNEIEMTNGYSTQVGAILNDGTAIPSGTGNLVVFNNTLGWSNVYLYTSSSNIWNGDLGCTTNGATRYTMTQISGTNYWYAYVSNTASILFMKDIQDGYDNIYNTSASYRTDYNSQYPMFTPDTTSNQYTNSTTYYSNGSWSGQPTVGSQSANIYLQSTLYSNGVWAGVKEVWIYENGTSSIVTLRRDLLDMIDNMNTTTYNNGVNTENYTEESWTDFVDAFENAQKISGRSTSTQTQIDAAEVALQAAYDALTKQTYLLVVVTQVGAIGTVVVGDTTITNANGSAQVDHNSNVTINVAAPQNYYVTSIVADGEVYFTNSNQTITAKSVTVYGVTEDVEVEVHYERKLSYTITVNAYDSSAGILYYNDEALDPAGDAITVFAGESVTITSSSNEGYAVKSWTIDQSAEFHGTSYTFVTVKENHELTVQWQKISKINVAIIAKPNAAGYATATVDGQTASTKDTSTMTVDQYDTITLTAVSTDPRYMFEGWSIEGEFYSADNTTRYDETYNIVATSDVIVTAKYVEVYRKIYLENDADWDQPYLYFWGSNIETDTWPGTAMTYDDEIGYWYGYIPYEATDIQFNDGTDQNKVEFSDVTPNLYNNATGYSGTYIEEGYYLQGTWNDVHHSAYDLEKFEENADGTYSITIVVTKTNDGYIYVNPSDHESNFYQAEYDGKTDNPQNLEFVDGYTDTPRQVKVEIDTNDFDLDYEVTFTFDPSDNNNFSWTTTPLIPTLTVVATDGRSTNSSDTAIITNNNRIGDTYFDTDTVVKVTNGLSFEEAEVISGEVVTFSTQLNPNTYGTYDYYVYGWVINGTEFVTASNLGAGLYSGSYIFTEDNSTVVPVYFHTDAWLAANGVEQVTVYAVADKNITNWDAYLSAYTWYNLDNELDYYQFGKYPGQLMIPVAGLDGVYYTYVETTSENGVDISGIIFSNYAPAEGMDTVVVDYTNIQSYDYYEFKALLEDGRENITFVIKNQNQIYNADRLSTGTKVDLDEYTFVQYTDYSSLKTDIFGNNIESINDTLLDKNALYVIQAGDQASHEGVLSGDNYVKSFFYDAQGNYLGSCFSYELHDKDSEIWTLLAEYENQRAYFSYEAMNENRYDGEWYGDNDINVNVNVSVNVGLTTDGGKSFTVNTTDPANVALYGAGYIDATEQNIDIFRGSKFTLTAVPGKGYRFVGWYSQNGMLFSTNISYVATSAVGATYTAVFEELEKDNFYVNHYIYTGVGTTSSYIPKPHSGNAQLYVGIENVTSGLSTPLTLTESAFISASVGDKLIITVATDAIGADKFYAWYVQSYDKYGFTSFEEVGVDSYDNIYNNNGTVVGRSDMVYFQFEYTVKKDVHSMTLYSDLMPISAVVTLEYQYVDRYGKSQSYYVPYELTPEEIIGFAGNNFTPYTPAYLSGEGWTNTILANAPYIDIANMDTTWTINSAMYDTMTFVLWATQPDTLYTITSQVDDSVLIYQLTYGSVLELDARMFVPEISTGGFWYNDINNNGSYDADIDRILTYGPRYGYRVTCDMNINYEVAGSYDFDITIDDPVYSREQSSNADGSNKTDKVTVDFMVNILTPYFFDGKTFIPDASKDEEMGMHVTVDALERAGYTVDYGVILEQVGSFMPGTTAYPTYEAALAAAQAKNFGTATDSDILINEVITDYSTPVMTSAGTYCLLYNTKNLSISNKNRYQFAFAFTNSAANQKKFYNVYSYVTITTPEGVTTTYISNVQTLNIYLTGTSEAVVN